MSNSNLTHQKPKNKQKLTLRNAFLLSTAILVLHCSLFKQPLYLISSAIVAGELALSVDFLALFCVCVINNAVSGAGHDLLIVSMGHELCAEDVGAVSGANSCLDLNEKVRPSKKS